jgi:hypothetical protein
MLLDQGATVACLDLDPSGRARRRDALAR